ncbi:MAG: hypothetical protein PHG67_03740 [Bacteroidales bacterium]|nr:hypothetical protein [Bacteroidales bacterium]HOI31319.1 hypothetical protein [Bacteroidales bacterium]
MPSGEISELFKSYTLFDTLSYWVYINSDNQDVDTVFQLDYYTEKRYHTPVNQSPGFHYDAYVINFLSKKTGIIKGEITGCYTAKPSDTLAESYRLYFNNNRYFSILTPRYPRGEQQLLGIHEGIYTNESFHNTYEQNGTIFSAVFQVSVKDYQQAPDTVYMRFFMAKNVGLIRYSRQYKNETENWILSSWNASPAGNP